MLRSTLFYFAAILLHACIAKADPCTNYTNLNDPRRSTAYAREGLGICDATITEQWYRSVSGAGPDMPTTAVPIGRCGTEHPVWINDTLPSQDVEKEVNLCTVHAIFGNCYHSFTIKVKNCGDFNVYYLLQTSGCPIAYCFGTELQCPDGQSSETGFTPGCKYVADIPLSLSVAASLTDGAHAGGNIYHKVLKFDCNLASTPQNTNVLFEVRWYIEDEEVANFTEKKYTELSQTALTKDRWAVKYHMGFSVKCQMRVRYVNYSIPGPFHESAVFFAGFMVDKTELTVAEGGQPVELNVSLTVPVECVINRTIKTTSDCTVRVHARETKSHRDKCKNGFQTGEDLVFKNLNCYLEFEHGDYTSTKTLLITGKTDSLYNSNDRKTHLQLLAEQRDWTSKSIQDIKVSVVDKEYQLKNRYCASNSGPYITTFDGKWFSNHRAGEFILYRHKQFPVSVQVMYSACPGRWGNPTTCNCGVAIRSDDAMFIANFCGHITTHHYVSGLPTNRYVEKVSCDDKHMVVVYKGNEYEITLPMGTVVKYTYREVGERIIIDNILIKPSIEDIKSSSGLCGYLDNDDNNPLVLRDGSTTTDYSVFAEEWRMKTTSGDVSLFNTALNLQKDNVPLRQYCVCGESASEIFCELSSAMELCRNTYISQTLSKPYYIRCAEDRPRSKRSLLMYSSHSIYKRSTEDEDNIDRIDLTYDPDYKDQPTEPKWMNGWNAASAEVHCVKEFEAYTLATLCKNEVPGYGNEIEKIKNECIATIKVAGNTDFVFSSLAALRSSCLSEATRLEILTESASKSGNDSRTLLDDILDVSCVNNCSGNGTCVSGQCQCFIGYYGSFCNLQKTVPPIIRKTSNSWKCKTDKKPCRSYGITGSGFIFGSLTCKARLFQIFGDGRHQETDTVLTFAGTYVNEISCSCSFPNSRRRREASSETIIAEGYYMSVSNDGTTFSEEITFINYDSSCYECNVTSITCSEHSACVKEPTTVKSFTTTIYETRETTSVPDKTVTKSFSLTTVYIDTTSAAAEITSTDQDRTITDTDIFSSTDSDGISSVTNIAMTPSTDITTTNVQTDKTDTGSSTTAGVDTTKKIMETNSTGQITNMAASETTASNVVGGTNAQTTIGNLGSSVETTTHKMGQDTTTSASETTTKTGVDGTNDQTITDIGTTNTKGVDRTTEAMETTTASQQKTTNYANTPSYEESTNAELGKTYSSYITASNAIIATTDTDATPTTGVYTTIQISKTSSTVQDTTKTDEVSTINTGVDRTNAQTIITDTGRTSTTGVDTTTSKTTPTGQDTAIIETDTYSTTGVDGTQTIKTYTGTTSIAGVETSTQIATTTLTGQDKTIPDADIKTTTLIHEENAETSETDTDAISITGIDSGVDTTTQIAKDISTGQDTITTETDTYSMTSVDWTSTQKIITDTSATSITGVDTTTETAKSTSTGEDKSKTNTDITSVTGVDLTRGYITTPYAQTLTVDISAISPTRVDPATLIEQSKPTGQVTTIAEADTYSTTGVDESNTQTIIADTGATSITGVDSVVDTTPQIAKDISTGQDTIITEAHTYSTSDVDGTNTQRFITDTSATSRTGIDTTTETATTTSTGEGKSKTDTDITSANGVDVDLTRSYITTPYAKNITADISTISATRVDTTTLIEETKPTGQDTTITKADTYSATGVDESNTQTTIADTGATSITGVDSVVDTTPQIAKDISTGQDTLITVADTYSTTGVDGANTQRFITDTSATSITGIDTTTEIANTALIGEDKSKTDTDITSAAGVDVDLTRGYITTPYAKTLTVDISAISPTRVDPTTLIEETQPTGQDTTITEADTYSTTVIDETNTQTIIADTGATLITGVDSVVDTTPQITKDISTGQDTTITGADTYSTTGFDGTNTQTYTGATSIRGVDTSTQIATTTLTLEDKTMTDADIKTTNVVHEENAETSIPDNGATSITGVDSGVDTTTQITKDISTGQDTIITEAHTYSTTGVDGTNTQTFITDTSATSRTGIDTPTETAKTALIGEDKSKTDTDITSAAGVNVYLTRGYITTPYAKTLTVDISAISPTRVDPTTLIEETQPTGQDTTITEADTYSTTVIDETNTQTIIADTVATLITGVDSVVDTTPQITKDISTGQDTTITGADTYSTTGFDGTNTQTIITDTGATSIRGVDTSTQIATTTLTLEDKTMTDADIKTTNVVHEENAETSIPDTGATSITEIDPGVDTTTQIAKDISTGQDTIITEADTYSTSDVDGTNTQTFITDTGATSRTGIDTPIETAMTALIGEDKSKTDTDITSATGVDVDLTRGYITTPYAKTLTVDISAISPTRVDPTTLIEETKPTGQDTTITEANTYSATGIDETNTQTIIADTVATLITGVDSVVDTTPQITKDISTGQDTIITEAHIYSTTGVDGTNTQIFITDASATSRTGIDTTTETAKTTSTGEGKSKTDTDIISATGVDIDLTRGYITTPYDKTFTADISAISPAKVDPTTLIKETKLTGQDTTITRADTYSTTGFDGTNTQTYTGATSIRGVDTSTQIATTTLTLEDKTMTDADIKTTNVVHEENAETSIPDNGATSITGVDSGVDTTTQITKDISTGQDTIITEAHTYSTTGVDGTNTQTFITDTSATSRTGIDTPTETAKTALIGEDKSKTDTDITSATGVDVDLTRGYITTPYAKTLTVDISAISPTRVDPTTLIEETKPTGQDTTITEADTYSTTGIDETNTQTIIADTVATLITGVDSVVDTTPQITKDISTGQDTAITEADTYSTTGFDGTNTQTIIPDTGATSITGIDPGVDTTTQIAKDISTGQDTFITEAHTYSTTDVDGTNTQTFIIDTSATSKTGIDTTTETAKTTSTGEGKSKTDTDITSATGVDIDLTRGYITTPYDKTFTAEDISAISPTRVDPTTLIEETKPTGQYTTITKADTYSTTGVDESNTQTIIADTGATSITGVDSVVDTIPEITKDISTGPDTTIPEADIYSTTSVDETNTQPIITDTSATSITGIDTTTETVKTTSAGTTSTTRVASTTLIEETKTTLTGQDTTMIDIDSTMTTGVDGTNDEAITTNSGTSSVTDVDTTTYIAETTLTGQHTTNTDVGTTIKTGADETSIDTDIATTISNDIKSTNAQTANSSSTTAVVDTTTQKAETILTGQINVTTEPFITDTGTDINTNTARVETTVTSHDKSAASSVTTITTIVDGTNAQITKTDYVTTSTIGVATTTKTAEATSTGHYRTTAASDTSTTTGFGGTNIQTMTMNTFKTGVDTTTQIAGIFSTNQDSTTTEKQTTFTTDVDELFTNVGRATTTSSYVTTATAVPDTGTTTANVDANTQISEASPRSEDKTSAETDVFTSVDTTTQMAGIFSTNQDSTTTKKQTTSPIGEDKTSAVTTDVLTRYADVTTSLSSTVTIALDPEQTTIASDTSNSNVLSTVTSDIESTSSSTNASKASPTSFPSNLTAEKSNMTKQARVEKKIIVGILSACVSITTLVLFYLVIKRRKLKRKQCNGSRRGTAESFSNKDEETRL